MGRCCGSQARLCPPRVALYPRIQLPLAQNTRTPLLLSHHTLSGFNLPLRTPTNPPLSFFLSWALRLLARGQLFFPNSEPGKMIEPACVAKGLVSTGSEGRNGAVSFSPPQPPPRFLPLAKRPGSI